MLNTFDALAKFPSEENGEENSNTTTEKNETNAGVDISAIVNRLNEMETKINELLNKSTEFPTRGKTDENAAPENGGANTNNAAPENNNGASDNKGE